MDRPRWQRSMVLAPPPLLFLLMLVTLLTCVWLFQGGSIDRLAGGVAQTHARTSLDDQNTSAAARSVETDALRGYAGAWYQVYFTKPTDAQTQSDRSGGLDQAIAADVQRAQQRIEVAVFDLDLPRVVAALVQAQQRGVAVRVAIDGVNLGAPEVAAATGKLEAAAIPVFVDQRNAFMHDKIVVIDDAIVWLGSANFTANDVFRNNNNMLRIVSPALAANYAAKTDDVMAGDGGPQGGSVLVNPRIKLGDASVVNAFAPDDAVADLIEERIRAARSSVEVLAFAYTSDQIAAAMIDARARGLRVRGVIESRNAGGSGSQYAVLRSAGIDMHPDGNCAIMHHKVIVIDRQTVITGSFNFTRAAQEQNDENVLLVDDPTLAARYAEEFERVYQQALHPSQCE